MGIRTFLTVCIHVCSVEQVLLQTLCGSAGQTSAVALCKGFIAR